MTFNFKRGWVCHCVIPPYKRKINLWQRGGGSENLVSFCVTSFMESPIRKS